MGSLLELLMKFFSGTIIFYMMIVIVTYGSMLILAFIQLRKQYLIDKNEVDEDDIDAFYSKPVSIIVPAYNEEAGIIDSIHSILSLRYPQIELIIVNDGSTDNTQRKIIEQFRMKEVQGTIANHIPTKPIRHFYQSDIHPNVWLIEKENGERRTP